MEMNTPVRPLVLTTPPPVVKPKYKRQYISSDEDEEFVPAKLYFPLAVHDEETRLNQDAMEGSSTWQPCEDSQVWDGLLEELPDSWKLVPAENSPAQPLATTGDEAASTSRPSIAEEEEDSQIWDIPDALIIAEIPDYRDPISTENAQTASQTAEAAKPLSFGRSPGERIMAARKLLKMKSIENTASITPWQREQNMRSIIRATVYGVVKHCMSECAYQSCEGCCLEAPAQAAHQCLEWTHKTIDRKLKFVCSELCANPIVLLIMSIAYATKCLSFTQDHMDMVYDLLNKIEGAVNSHQALETILQPTDKETLKIVKSNIKDLHYKSFFSRQKTPKLNGVTVM
ncbi:PREDICTED: uncharacterized protein LOC107108088 [Gekko japonicus]|uniref:Uncharacterized protein LOC107108088 n=1 Tax=Gekko japonicus TaxID=146911 RepID=A0ABM1JR80_GEKJA|nr:PREDICTED: uncharacterized protein LOC107108088 [Gekko japonicus]